MPRHDVVDVGEVAPHLAAIEQGQRLARKQRLGEDPHRHVRAAPRPVDREEAQTRARQPEDVGIGLAHQLVRLLACRVERERMIDPVLHPKRERLVAPVDGRRGGVDEMARTAAAGELQHVAVADQVRLEVGAGILEAVANAGLSPEVNDPIEVGRAAQLVQGAGIREIDPFEPETIAEIARERVEARLLQRWIVIIVEIVDPDDLLAASEKRACCRRPDESTRARDEYRHAQPLSRSAARLSYS